MSVFVNNFFTIWESNSHIVKACPGRFDLPPGRSWYLAQPPRIRHTAVTMDASLLTTTRLEEITGNAWPALQTRLYDGWLLRTAKRVSKRSNSVWPLYGSTVDAETKINECERFYRSIGQRCIFKLTDQSVPTDLDARLAARGYVVVDRTLVQTLELSTRTPSGSKAPDGLRLHTEVGFTDAWSEAFAQAGDLYRDALGTTAELFSRITDTVITVRATRSPAMVGCGYVVIDAASAYAGLYAISVMPHVRRCGIGRAITAALLSAAADGGAGVAYLQVVEENAPARALYAQLGFTEHYAYWYRVEKR